MGRSLVIGSVAFAGMLMGATTVAQADHYCHPGAYRYGGYHGGYGVGIGVGYAPRAYYAPPPVVYAPPVYAPPPPVYYAPSPYPYGYAPYPAAGLGVSTKSFGLWLGR